MSLVLCGVGVVLLAMAWRHETFERARGVWRPTRSLGVARDADAVESERAGVGLVRSVTALFFWSSRRRRRASGVASSVRGASKGTEDRAARVQTHAVAATASTKHTAARLDR